MEMLVYGLELSEMLGVADKNVTFLIRGGLKTKTNKLVHTQIV